MNDGILQIDGKWICGVFIDVERDSMIIKMRQPAKGLFFIRIWKIYAILFE